MRTKKLFAVTSIVLMLAGASMLIAGSWIRAKAGVAQLLLEAAWVRTKAGDVRARPWPWADTYPVARIEFPSRHKSQIVLAGASGRTLAFGPGHVDGTAMPGETGNCVISGHRDTSFSLLRRVGDGETIVVESRTGKRTSYRVVSRFVADKYRMSLLRNDGTRLTLITCYPFDAIRPGGPLRYVVVAKKV